MNREFYMYCANLVLVYKVFSVLQILILLIPALRSSTDKKTSNLARPSPLKYTPFHLVYSMESATYQSDRIEPNPY